MGRLSWSGQREEVTTRRVQVFDVNETLLDLAAMDPHFERIFGDAGVRRSWFSQMMPSALVATITGAYSQYTVAAIATTLGVSRASIYRHLGHSDNLP